MGTGKKKIEIKRKEKKSDRVITFTKRRKGLFKKASEFHSLTGAELALLVFSTAGNPYIHPDKPSFDATINKFLGSTTIITTNTNSNTSGPYASTSTCHAVPVGQQKSSSKSNDNIDHWLSWLNNLKVEECDNMEELIGIKMGLEEIQKKLVNKIEQHEVEDASFLAITNCFY